MNANEFWLSIAFLFSFFQLKNDQFDMDVLSAIMVKKFSGDQKLAHDAIEVIRGCLQPIESDRCDKITQILECSYAKWYTSEEHKQKDRL